MKTEYIIIAVIVILIIVLVITYKARAINIFPTTIKDTTKATTTTNTNIVSKFPLKKGSEGKEVENVQRYINRLIMAAQPIESGTPPYIKEDGDWGSITETAIKKYIGGNVVTESMYNTWKSQGKFKDSFKK